MSKQKDKILDVVSNLDDEIVEKASRRRFSMFMALKARQKKRRNLLISIGSVAACLAILFPVILGLLRPDDPTTPVEPPVGGQVPIYTGMTMSNEYVATASTPAYASPATLARGNGSGNNGNHFGNDKQPIKDAAADHLGVTPSAQDDYYAAPNSDIYITVHFENPDEYEILSFRLNGVKYAVQQFLPGSDLENLIIKLNVGDVEGLQSYTITEIKYVDGESITERDVLMRGDDTIKVYVSYKEQPTATVTGETVGFDSISFGVSVTNPNNVIGADSLWAVLYDGETILQKQALTVGENTVAFNGLTTGTLYQYAIVARYNAYDGEGDVLHVLQEAMVSTAAVLTFADARLVGNTYYFRLAWHEQIGDRTLLSLALYEGGTKVQDVPLDATCIENLEQNRSYRLVATYAYGEGQETIETAFETKTVYAITFVSNGGEELGTISLSLEDTLPTPVREGYTFGGWYSDVDLTQKVESVPNEAITLYGYWKGDNKPGDLVYTVSNSTITVSDISDMLQTGGKIVIPAYIGGIPVTDVDFSGNTKITEVTLPDSMTELSFGAFRTCTSLTHVTIPNSISRIGTSAFYQCSALQELVIPASVVEIGNFAFAGLESVVIDANNPVYHCAGNCIIETNTRTLVVGFRNAVIPTDGSVTSIGAGAFLLQKMDSIDVPNTITAIGNEAFGSCTNLMSITIPDSVASIGSNIFRECTSLESVVLSNGITQISNGAFNGCTALKSITIPEGVTVIEYNAFLNCTSLVSVSIPNSIMHLNPDVFSGCSNLIQTDGGVHYIDKWVVGSDDTISGAVTLRADTVGICSSAFQGRAIESVEIPDSMRYIGASAFKNCTRMKTINVPSSVTYIGSQAFDGCTALQDREGGVLYAGSLVVSCDASATSVTLRDGTVGILPSAFYNCSSLTEIVLPDTVNFIGDRAFWGCSSLKRIEIPEGVRSIEKMTFWNCTALTEVILPDTLTFIDNLAFGNCKALTSIEIPANVSSIIVYAFGGCSGLESITVDENNPYYHSVDGCLIETETKTLFAGCKNSVIPSDGSVTVINGAFDGCSGLVSIVIPKEIVRIERSSFSGCTALEEIMYLGTCAEWEAIEKADNWKEYSSITVIRCIDGDIVIE